LSPSLLGSLFLDDLVPEICEALSSLYDREPDFGYDAINRFFEIVSASWNSLVNDRRIATAARVWTDVLDQVRAWESRSGKRIHKGTPYYFLGSTYIFGSDFNLGFRYLYDAIEEDRIASKKSSNPTSFLKAPAYMVASLINDPKNFLFLPFVKPARNRIDLFLEKYRTQSPSSIKLSLNLPDFEKKFLTRSDMEVEKLYFVYVLFELIKAEGAWSPQSTYNDFSKMRNRDLLFDLCLIIEQVLKILHPGPTTIGPVVYAMCSSKGWLTHKEANAGDFNNQLNPKITGPSADPDIIVPALLDRTISYGGSQVGVAMSWPLLAWHLRNHSAHTLAPERVLVERYDEIVQGLMNSLFVALE
jgi:hypothetical protein